jgi:hypothetical protein
MMGLEPTTFCMANSSELRLESAANRMVERKTALSPTRSAALRSRSFPGDSARFGHKNLACAQTRRCRLKKRWSDSSSMMRHRSWRTALVSVVVTVSSRPPRTEDQRLR